jgi:hypothetical protein
MFRIDINRFRMSKREVAMNKSIKLSAASLVHQSMGSTVAKRLLPGQIAALRHGKGERLYCDSGRLWVTLEHCPDDVVLEAQQSLDIAENGLVLVSALGSATFRFARR